jgi:hypothetical protein
MLRKLSGAICGNEGGALMEEKAVMVQRALMVERVAISSNF